jgi:hypothetical protein
LRKFLRALHKYTRHEELILVGAALAAAVMAFPLQHYIQLALWQHRAIAMLITAFFASMQVGISWRSVSAWGKLSLSCLAIVLTLLGKFCWENPWLGNLDLATSEQLFQGQLFAIFMALVVTLLLVVSIGWLFEKKLRAAANPNETERTPR